MNQTVANENAKQNGQLAKIRDVIREFPETTRIKVEHDFGNHYLIKLQSKNHDSGVSLVVLQAEAGLLDQAEGADAYWVSNDGPWTVIELDWVD